MARIIGDDAARFASYVRIDPATGCHVWTGARSRRGYGILCVDGRTVQAHRFAWEQGHGPIPDGLFVCHRCDNPPCVNLDDLFLGTAAENNADRDRKGRTRHPRLDTLAHCPGRRARGERNGSARLTEDRVREMRDLRAEGATQRELAERFGVSTGLVSFVVRRIYWTHVA